MSTSTASSCWGGGAEGHQICGHTTIRSKEKKSISLLKSDKLEKGRIANLLAAVYLKLQSYNAYVEVSATESSRVYF